MSKINDTIKLIIDNTEKTEEILGLETEYTIY